MILQNTSRYEAAEVRELVDFGFRGLETAGVRLRVMNSRHAYRGSAADFGTRYANGYDILIRIGGPSSFPIWTKYPRLATAPRYELRCWHEALVAIAAHEGHHNSLHRVNRDRESRGLNRLPISEIQAERFAVVRVREFREIHRCESI